MRGIAAVFFGLWIFILLLFFLEYKQSRKPGVNSRMKQLAEEEDELRSGKREKRERFQNSFRQLIRSLAERLEKLRHSEALDMRMQQAGWPLLGSEFLVILGFVGVMSSLFFMMLTLQAVTALLGGAGTMMICWLYVGVRIRRRMKAFTNQLGDTLGIVANAMRAGFSFLQALELVAREMEAPMGTEVAQVMREVQLGATLEASLESMAKRVCSNDFDLLIAAVLIQRKVGGSLAQILDSISTTINERIRMKQEVRALTAQGRMSGYVLGALPFGLGLLLYTMNPAYMQPLFNESIGRMAIGFAVVWDGVGFVFIQKIVNMDV